MEYQDLTDEMKKKVQSCETSEEILALAKEEGYELTDDELEAVSGGWDHCNPEKYGCGMVGH